MNKNTWSNIPLLPVSWGEVFDKLTILQIKSEKLSDPVKLTNVQLEKQAIESVIGDINQFPEALMSLINQLKVVNEGLWDIEEGKRDCERHQRFDDKFIQLARRVYMDNDTRAAIKKDINILLGSSIVEEKSYQAY